MKKSTTILSAAALLFSASIFAADSAETSVSSKASSAFQKDFSSAKNVSWQKKNDVYFVSFDVNNNSREAAYNEQGELVGASRLITSAELPLAVSLAVAKKYEGYTVAKIATEITYENETNYYINVGNESQILRLKCSINGDITVDSKTKK